MVDSRLLELFRTDLLVSESHIDFVNEFLEDFIKVVVKAIDRDPALIRRFLRDRRANEDLEEGKEEEGSFDAKGLIPLMFERVKNHVPVKYFIYNTILDLTK